MCLFELYKAIAVSIFNYHTEPVNCSLSKRSMNWMPKSSGTKLINVLKWLQISSVTVLITDKSVYVVFTSGLKINFREWSQLAFLKQILLAGVTPRWQTELSRAVWRKLDQFGGKGLGGRRWAFCFHLCPSSTLSLQPSHLLSPCHSFPSHSFTFFVVSWAFKWFGGRVSHWVWVYRTHHKGVWPLWGHSRTNVITSGVVHKCFLRHLFLNSSPLYLSFSLWVQYSNYAGIKLTFLWNMDFYCQRNLVG